MAVSCNCLNYSESIVGSVPKSDIIVPIILWPFGIFVVLLHL